MVAAYQVRSRTVDALAPSTLNLAWNRPTNILTLLLVFNLFQNQYHGEVMASERLQGMLDQFRSSMTETEQKTVSIIAEQERNHSEWVGALLKARGEEPKVLEKVERYWDVVLTGLDSFLKATAVAAHAEGMASKYSSRMVFLYGFRVVRSLF
jgi:hypothetical protein